MKLSSRTLPGTVSVNASVWPTSASSPTDQDERIVRLADAAAGAEARFAEQHRSAGADKQQRARETRRRRCRCRRIDEMDRLGELGARRDIDDDAVLHQGRVERDDRILRRRAHSADRCAMMSARPSRQSGGERGDVDALRQRRRQFRRKDAVDENEALCRQRRLRAIVLPSAASAAALGAGAIGSASRIKARRSV